MRCGAVRVRCGAGKPSRLLPESPGSGAGRRGAGLPARTRHPQPAPAPLTCSPAPPPAGAACPRGGGGAAGAPRSQAGPPGSSPGLGVGSAAPPASFRAEEESRNQREGEEAAQPPRCLPEPARPHLAPGPPAPGSGTWHPPRSRHRAPLCPPPRLASPRPGSPAPAPVPGEGAPGPAQCRLAHVHLRWGCPGQSCTEAAVPGSSTSPRPRRSQAQAGSELRDAPRPKPGGGRRWLGQHSCCRPGRPLCVPPVPWQMASRWMGMACISSEPHPCLFTEVSLCKCQAVKSPVSVPPEVSSALNRGCRHTSVLPANVLPLF